jgi:hypothetical protein
MTLRLYSLSIPAVHDRFAPLQSILSAVCEVFWLHAPVIDGPVTASGCRIVRAGRHLRLALIYVG